VANIFNPVSHAVFVTVAVFVFSEATEGHSHAIQQPVTIISERLVAPVEDEQVLNENFVRLRAVV
jgi:hypothetical protein